MQLTAFFIQVQGGNLLCRSLVTAEVEKLGFPCVVFFPLLENHSSGFKHSRLVNNIAGWTEYTHCVYTETNTFHHIVTSSIFNVH